MGDRLKVDTAELRRVGGGLERVAEALAGSDGQVRLLGEVAGSHRVQDALADLHGDWRHRRAGLVRDARGLARSADEVAGSFEQCESSLTESLQKTGGAR